MSELWLGFWLAASSAYCIKIYSWFMDFEVPASDANLTLWPSGLLLIQLQRHVHLTSCFWFYHHSYLLHLLATDLFLCWKPITVIWVELFPSITSWLQGFSLFFFFPHSDGFRDRHYSWASKSKSFQNYQKKWPFWIGVCLVGWVWAWYCWWLFCVTGV